MGINLTFKKHFLTLDDLRERRFAVDAFVVLYQFLAYTEGVTGVSLNMIFKLVHNHWCFEDIPDEYLDQLPEDREAICYHFAEPEITDVYTYQNEEFDENGLLDLPCNEQGFSKDHVETLLKRMWTSGSRKSLTQWMRC